jgi:DNA-binding LytR/AlgR family response regulator
MNFILIPFHSYTHCLPFSWNEIQRIEGDGNYTRFILTNGKKPLFAKNIGLYAHYIPKEFIRILKGCIVNQRFIATLNPDTKTILPVDQTIVKAARRKWKTFTQNYHTFPATLS